MQICRQILLPAVPLGYLIDKIS